MASESRTDRLERMLGAEGLNALAQASVMVVGVGGVGSNCVEALARSGVGALVIVDPDTIQESNINRQAIAFESTVGRSKVDVLKEMILDINPDAVVTCVRERVLPDDVAALMEAHPVDYCIDAQDTILTKIALADCCAKRDIEFISSMGAANTVNPLNLAFADIYETSACPLSRSVRKKARKVGLERMSVLYSREVPVPTTAQEGAKREERTDLGTMSYMPAIMGQMIAARVICNILGIEWE